jgi:hypothetical protein
LVEVRDPTSYDYSAAAFAAVEHILPPKRAEGVVGYYCNGDFEACVPDRRRTADGNLMLERHGR